MTIPKRPRTTVLLLGPTGSGKTYSIRSFIPTGVVPFVISTEPGIEATLGDIPDPHLHWKYIPPATQSWADLMDSSKKINTLSYKALADLPGINKAGHAQFLEFLGACNNFKCDRCGESFGDVLSWGPERALVVDSLSGLSIMAMNLVVGSKPTKAMSDWMVAQDNLERVITTLVTNTKCSFVLTGHVERETDEVTGAMQIMASTLGRKLAPRLPRFFDEVVLAVRNGRDFAWSTTAPNADLKARRLPLADRIVPTFATLLKGGESPSA